MHACMAINLAGRNEQTKKSSMDPKCHALFITKHGFKGLYCHKDCAYFHKRSKDGQVKGATKKGAMAMDGMDH